MTDDQLGLRCGACQVGGEAGAGEQQQPGIVRPLVGSGDELAHPPQPFQVPGTEGAEACIRELSCEDERTDTAIYAVNWAEYGTLTSKMSY